MPSMTKNRETARYKVSDGARYSFNAVLINQMTWQPTLSSYERFVLNEMKEWNARYLEQRPTSCVHQQVPAR